MMAFAIRNLSELAYAATGFTLWHYRAGRDIGAEVDTANYFAGAADIMTGGDMILIGAADCAFIRYVTVAGARTVTTSALGRNQPSSPRRWTEVHK